jgi:hypothetical protein
MKKASAGSMHVLSTKNVYIGIDVHKESWHAGITLKAETLKRVYGDIPTLIMEGDIVDASTYNEVDIHNRIDAFIEAFCGS